MVLLLCACLLFISQTMRWWPSPDWQASIADGFSKYTFLHYDLRVWAGIIRLATLPILLAAASAYFVCFWPGPRPVRRLILWVLLPGAGGILLVWGGALVLASCSGEPRFASILESSGSNFTRSIRLTWRLTGDLGPGLHFALAGFLLVTIAALLLRRGHTSLPVSLYRDAPGVSLDTDPGIRREQRFIWYAIALNPIATSLFAVPISLLSIFVLPRLYAGNLSSLWSLSALFGSMPFLVVALWAMGSERKQVLSQAVRPPPITIAALSGALPVVIAGVVPLVSFLYDRIHWAAYYWGTFGPPEIRTYFTLPNVQALWYFPPAFVEEIAWRGHLQPRFIRRFGMARGIFLVGIVWGAFHFGWDFRSSLNSRDVLLALAVRLIKTTTFSFALAWVTLRANSFIPAAIMHATDNSFLNLSATPSHPVALWIVLGLWAALGFVLFRYWPPQNDSAPIVNTGASSSNPVV